MLNVLSGKHEERLFCDDWILYSLEGHIYTAPQTGCQARSQLVLHRYFYKQAPQKPPRCLFLVALTANGNT